MYIIFTTCGIFYHPMCDVECNAQHFICAQNLRVSSLQYTVFVILLLLSTHADRQSVDISVTVCNFVCFLFVRLRISLSRIELAASNFARWFIGVLDRESPILWNFAPPEAQNRTNRPPTRKQSSGWEELA